MKEENQDDERHDDRLLDQRVTKRVDGFTDQPRTIVGGHDLDAGRHRALHVAQLRLHLIDDAQRVLAEPHDDDPADDLALTVQLGHAAPDIGT